MSQLSLNNLFAGLNLMLAFKSSFDLDSLAARPASSSISTLIDMMNPIGMLSTLESLRAYLLTLPTLYPTKEAPDETYTTVQRSVLQGLRRAVAGLDPGSFDVLGSPVVSVFANSMRYADELQTSLTSVLALIDAELARGQEVAS